MHKHDTVPLSNAGEGILQPVEHLIDDIVGHVQGRFDADGLGVGEGSRRQHIPAEETRGHFVADFVRRDPLAMAATLPLSQVNRVTT